MFKKPSFSIVGPGALGSALLDSLDAAGYSIESVYTRRRPDTYPIEKRFPGKFKQGLPTQESELGEYLFLTPPDDVISDLAERLAAIPAIQWENRKIIHCSGALSSDSLEPLGRKGALTASYHPLQTFTQSSDRNTFRDIAVSIEGNPALAEELAEIAADLWSNPIRVSKQQKQALHVAAVFISNYTVALGGVADQLIKKHLDGQDYSILKPLLNQTLSNMIQQDLPSALTGPVARGDLQTVRSHLEILQDDKEKLKLYKILGNSVLKLSYKKGLTTEERLSKLSELFKDDD
ncbi:MAG: Rossmann-like and DUF2520 domain-containing protein [Balneolaceae bacterium]